MEKQSSMITTNGNLRRKYKSEEDGGRDRRSKRERERGREMISRSKRPRGREEDSTEEEEQEEFVVVVAASSSSSLLHHHHHVHQRMLHPSNTASSSYHHLNNNHNKGSPSSFKSRPATIFKAAADEMIGVSVPRKARSVSVKRLNENRASSMSGGSGVVVDEKMNQSGHSASPARRTGEVDSPSCSTVSVRKKMKVKMLENQASNLGNLSSGLQEDIEYEIAEVLFGMKEQSSNKPDDVPADSSQKLETKSSNLAAVGTSKSSNLSTVENSSDVKRPTSVLAQNTVTESDPPREEELKRKNVAVANNAAQAVPGTKGESEQSAKKETSSSKLENDMQAVEASGDMVAAKGTSESVELKQNIELENLKPSKEEVNAQDKLDSKARLASLEEESTFELHDSAPRKEISKVSEVKKDEAKKKFEIDLNHMMDTTTPSSQESGSLNAIELDSVPIKEEGKMNSDALIKDEKVQTSAEKEAGTKECDDKKRVRTLEKTEKPKFDIEKLDQQTRTAIPKGEKASQSSTLPLPVVVAGLRNDLPSLGYLPSFPTALPIDGKTGSSTAYKTPEFLLCQAQPKRCSMHQYIARNIELHQKFIQMTQYWPAATCSAALCGMKTNNANAMPSVGSMVFGTSLQGSGPNLSLNHSQEKGHADVEKDRSSGAHSAQRNQLLPQQAQHPALANNLPHGQPFVFPLINNQQSLPATTNQTPLSKSATSIKNTSSSSSSASRPPTGLSPLPVAAGTVSFNLPNLAGNEAPLLAVLQNKGYSFPISTPVEVPPALGGTSGQPLHFFNGSFCPPHLFHPPRLQQQPHSHSQTTALSTLPDTSMQTSSSSSNKKPQEQLQKTAQFSGSGLNTLKNLHFQQPQKQKEPLTASRLPQVQKNIYGQNIAVPTQPMSFTLMPSSTRAGNGSENYQAVQLVPSQTFTTPFASFGGNNISSTLNFSSMAQNSTLVKSLQGVAQYGYKVAAASQTVHHKSSRISHGKNKSDSNSGGKKATSGKAATSTGQSLVFDISSRTLNFMSSPVNQSSRSSALSGVATTATLPSSVQQQQLLELQKQQSVQQQPSGVSRSRISTTSSLSSIQPLIHCNRDAQSSQYKNPAKTSTSQVTKSTSSTLKNLPEQGRSSSQVVTHISFGQQITPNYQAPQPLL